MNHSTTYVSTSYTPSETNVFEDTKLLFEGCGCPSFSQCDFTGKETDCETGLSYFGARYYDPTLLTSWTAIDPMSDKYPRLSPYNYCAWNPMKVIDPNGCDTFNIDISHGRIYWQPADGNHSIKFCIIGKQNKLEELEELRIEDIPMESLSLDFDLSESFTTTYLKFSDDILGYSVFNTTITLSDKYMGKNAMEWDYYSMQGGGGEISSSGEPGRVYHAPNRYTHDNARCWEHYHPNSQYYTSDADKSVAKKLNIPSYLNTGGRRYRFDDLYSGKYPSSMDDEKKRFLMAGGYHRQ